MMAGPCTLMAGPCPQRPQQAHGSAKQRTQLFLLFRLPCNFPQHGCLLKGGVIADGGGDDGERLRVCGRCVCGGDTRAMCMGV